MNSATQPQLRKTETGKKKKNCGERDNSTRVGGDWDITLLIMNRTKLKSSKEINQI